MKTNQESGPGPFPGQSYRALHLFALVQAAIAFPVYELLSRYPEFFVARQSQPGDIVFLVLALSAGLPVALFGLQALMSRFNARFGRAVHLLLIAFLFLFLGISVSGKILEGSAPLVVGIVFCLLFTVAYWRTAAGRLFVSFLSPAILLVPLLFVFNDEIASLLQTEEPVAAAGPSSADAAVPVIFVVFDELPTFALLDDSGAINAELFPNFHALAGTSNWYPNATTVATSTVLAMPPMLTGRYPTEFVMPHHGEFPDNLFTWLGSDYDLNVHEAVSAMCPSSLCGTGRLPPAASRWHDLMLDVSAIYLNILAADLMRGQLPVITQSWEDFWVTTEPGARLYEHRLQQLDDFVAQIRASGTPGLEFIHANFPHIPYEYLASGKRYQEGWLLPGMDIASDSWVGTEWQSAQAYRRFMLQLAALDGWLGRLVSKLKSENLFDPALLVITADHGVSFTPGSSRRDASPIENLAENILPVPLIIKAPQQKRGVVSDRNAETIDIMPTLADLLNRPLTWTVDGVSLLGDPKPPGKRAVHSYKDLEIYTTGVEEVAAGIKKAFEKIRFPGREGELGEFRAASHPELIGAEVSGLPIRRSKDLAIRIDHAAYFSKVEPDSGFLPAHVSGSMDWPDNGGAGLAIALNGRIAAVTRIYADGSGWRFSAVLPESVFRSGKNSLQVFVIDTKGPGRLTLVAGGSAAGVEDYRRIADGNGLSSAGGKLIIDQAGITGGIDYISRGEESAEVLGWAIDSANSSAVKAILVFDGQRLVYTGKTHMLREETHQFGVVTEVGFHAVIPFSQMKDKSGAGLRVYAVTEDQRFREITGK